MSFISAQPYRRKDRRYGGSAHSAPDDTILSQARMAAAEAHDHFWPPQGFASACSFFATTKTSRAASAFIAAMPMPTRRSGHGDNFNAVTNPAAMMAKFAITSFRADRKAARERLPP